MGQIQTFDLYAKFTCFFTILGRYQLAFGKGKACQVLQHYYLCRAVPMLTLPSALKDGLTFPDLLEVVVSGFFPQQAAAYLLGKK